jgi:large subunit ribosomal protein L17
MRHLKAHRKLGRTSAHRVALLKNLAISLIRYEKIETTLPKAKELKAYFDKLVTKAKKADFNAHRAVFSELQDKESVKKLMNEVAPMLASKTSGYTSIVKTNQRKGDAALMATISIVSAE